MFAAEVVGSIVLVVVLLTGSAAGISQADDLMGNAAFNYVAGAEGQAKSRDTAGAPLLPCPNSIPCLPVASHDQAGQPSTAVASTGLLPCPFSVPCFSAGPNTELHIERSPATFHRSYPAARPRTHFSDRRAHPKTRKMKIRTRITVERLNLAGSRRRPSAKPPGELALRGDLSYEQQARTMLQAAQLKLGRVDPTQLRANQSQVYAKASGLTKAGLQALQAHDNLAALAFAEKAQILIADL